MELARSSSKVLRETVMDKTNNWLSYKNYRQLIDDLLKEGKTTGANQSEDLLNYAKLNVARMNRLDKTIEISQELEKVVAQITSTQVWLVISEGWCGDASQIVPLFPKIAEMNSNIEVRFLLRDEHLPLMDQYLQNGKSRSIPKLVVANEQGEELFSWGPRPAAAQDLFNHLKANNASYDTIKEEIQRWYTKDKTQNVQQELVSLLKENM
jgi:hypothetical protein